MGARYGEDVPSAAAGRRAGVLLHPTSLPGPYGAGEIGAEAFKFVDWLASAGMQARPAALDPPPKPYVYTLDPSLIPGTAARRAPVPEKPGKGTRRTGRGMSPVRPRCSCRLRRITCTRAMPLRAAGCLAANPKP